MRVIQPLLTKDMSILLSGWMLGIGVTSGAAAFESPGLAGGLIGAVMMLGFGFALLWATNKDFGNLQFFKDPAERVEEVGE